jgi:heme-degrading monooxygenase HmoA
MYTRNIRINLKAGSVPEFTRLLENEIIPLLRQQKGFQDEISFVAPERNEAVAVSFWDNQENAEAYSHVAYLDVLRVLSKVAAGMPILDTFEVGTSTFRQMAASVC